MVSIVTYRYCARNSILLIYSALVIYIRARIVATVGRWNCV